MDSNTEKGRAFQIRCREALKRALRRDFNIEVSIDIGGGKAHSFDLATQEQDIVAECKALKYTDTGNIPSAKISSLREAANYLGSLRGDVIRILIVKLDQHPKQRETLGRYFVRLNRYCLDHISVLELPESGGKLVSIHGALVIDNGDR